VSLQHWENYYRGGALATCPLGPDSGYTQEVRDAWVTFFSDLPDGSRILDIGTGNGAIALIARETAIAERRKYEIHGTDLAQIDPVRDVPDGVRLLSGIRFHPQVATEQLPFDTGSFDAVSGHYALEYTTVDHALGEIHRVLKTGGRAQFILHNADSIVARNARESLLQTATVLEETTIFRKLRRYLQAERQSASATQKSRVALAEAIEVLRKAAGHTTNPLTLNVTLDAVQRILAARQRVSPAALALEIGRIEGNTRASVHRLRDLIRTAQTEAGVNRLAELARSRGFEVREMAPQYHAVSNLVGWRLRLAKP
jgi:ubiquinone/menaquinone biosynthesis C-methylase UbiE